MKFESKTVSYHHQTWLKFDNFLNQQGDNGWCPVDINTVSDGRDGFISRVTFTRHKEPVVQHDILELSLPDDDTVISSFIEPRVQQGWEVTTKFFDLRKKTVKVWLEKKQGE